jgi:hypothetical protein
MTRTLTTFAAAAVLAVSAGVASAATAPPARSLAYTLNNTMISGYSIKAPAKQTSARSNGIIMRDGGVCDPIRHMGC